MGKKAIYIPAGILFFLSAAGFLPNPVIGSSGYFKVDFFNNLLHLFFGLALLFAGVRSRKSADSMLKICGLFFIILSVLGFLFAKNGKLFVLLTASNPDNWLNLFFGIGFLALASKREKAANFPDPAG